jgi:hypothetical protein
LRLTGELEIKNFPNLKELVLYQSQLSKLKLGGVPQLAKIHSFTEIELKGLEGCSSLILVNGKNLGGV